LNRIYELVTQRKSVALKRACCEEEEEYFSQNSKWKQEYTIDLNKQV